MNTNNVLATEFFDKEFVNYASYDNLRKICSLVDGFKNTTRKIACTVLDKNITKPEKVSRLSAKFAEYTEYLHGDASGVIVGMAQNFPGANNLPLLTREGNFGNRFIPEASAARYIFTNGTDLMFDLFSKEDNEILTKQYFEGSKIEPLFYVPSLPLLLINGNDGVSSGFAQKILGRNPKKIKKYIEDYLNGSLKPNASNSLEPYFEGFNGSIEQGENAKQWLIKGTINKISQTKFEITEVPLGYSLKKYLDVLDDLEDAGVIKSYQDKSENDKFHFIVSVDSKFQDQFQGDKLLEKMKLIKKISENYTCLNEENKVIQPESAKEIIDLYIKVKIIYLQKRKDHLILSLDADIRKMLSQFIFIKNVTEDKIFINKRSKDNIIEQIKTFEQIIQIDGSYEYLLRLPLYSLTEEKLLELQNKIKDLKDKLDIIKNTSIEQMWLNDLAKIKL